MTNVEKAKLHAELTQAVIEAINQVGLATFKSSSMFGSSDRTVVATTPEPQ